MTHSEYLSFLTNMIGAVETGGQIYGRRRYSDYTGPYKNSSAEHTVTLGWAAFYGSEARKLVKRIYNMDPAEFRVLDGAGIEQMLTHDWVAERWNPTSAQKAALIRIISSQHGQTCQDAIFMELMEDYIMACEAAYTKDQKAMAMYCEIRHLGGKSGADRIFQRITSKAYTLDTIIAALKQDQSSSRYAANGVGCTKYWSRHTACRKMIEEHLTEDAMTPKERTKIFMREQSQKNLTGYTPTGSGCFKNAGAWTTVPKPGYVVYFWGKPSGESNKRVCHTGIVEKVDTKNKTFGTIEGNTSSSSWTTNGGCVARHTYSYASVGGQNRVHGFGIPDFEGAGITAEEYVRMAQSYVGYEEKKSNSQLDDFHANRGSNNYQKFQRDVVGYTGDQWCHYFVCAMALYCAGGDTGKSATSGGSGGGYMFTVSNVRNGSKGANVNLLQRLLDQAGFKGADGNRLVIDGDCGPNTVYAIKQYQAKMGLDVDGDCGPKTWGKILGV